MSGFFSRGFVGRRRVPEALADRLPPGQYYETGFPVLTAGPTPRVDWATWTFEVDGLVARPRTWRSAEFADLPFETVACDIHCVTKWSKLDTNFGGVSMDVFLDAVQPRGSFVLVRSAGGYTTNLALDDLSGGKAWIVTQHEGEPLAREHGGPARLLIPHLYLWKSAKWITGMRVLERDQAGFWERNGYHRRGDPWHEQRYRGD